MDTDTLKESFDNYFQLILKQVFVDFGFRVEVSQKEKDIAIEIFDDDFDIGKIWLDELFSKELFISYDEIENFNFEDSEKDDFEKDDFVDDLEFYECQLEEYKQGVILLRQIADNFENKINGMSDQINKIKSNFAKPIKPAIKKINGIAPKQ